MKIRALFVCLGAVCLTCGGGWASGTPATPLSLAALDSLAGQPVDIAPWAYLWRADRAVQEQPEACFIPHRLERLDKVYRTAHDALPPDQLKSIYYDMPDLLQPLLPPPAGALQTGLLWTGGVSKCCVELVWPEGGAIPSPEAVEVRVYPTSFGWFGWTVDRILANPAISADGRVWTYQSDPSWKMDSAYSAHVDAATEMVAVFYDRAKNPGGAPEALPELRVLGPSIGAWKRMDVEIEWGMSPEHFDGWLETSVALAGPAASLENGNGVTIRDGLRWKSHKPLHTARRGMVVPLLYAPDSCPGLDSRITVHTKKDGFTFRVSDLEKGPIFLKEWGVFVTKAGGGQTMRRFAAELAGKGLKSVREMTREHREAASWEELMREVRLWTCPEGTALTPYPPVPDPPMHVEVPDPGWTAAWRAVSNQLTGEHLWGGLAFEVGRVAHEMDMIGLHDNADKVYDHFLASPGVKPDGDYSDGDGALEWATAMRHDMGYSHDGTHASTGRLLFAMSERYFLTGDKEWFLKRRARLQAAADWIVRQRKIQGQTTNYQSVRNAASPSKAKIRSLSLNYLHVAGLMPPCMLGDYAIPSCDWHWYYVDNALSLQGLQRFADALSEFDAKAGRTYRREAEAFREDLRGALQREAMLAPVRLGQDGMYHGYLPRMAYARGITGPELGAPQFPECDRFMGALPLAEPFAALDANDSRMRDTLDMMEEMGTSPAAIQEKEAARKAKGLPVEDAWFWNPYVILPKASHNANIYLLQDDVPSFLRFWMNSYASVVGADGRLWEHWHLGNYDPCSTPDNGTAGWFMENFRDLLAMEERECLWAARATPRAWLEQGKKISIRNAPTYFGPFAYEIVSDVDHGKITATVEIPVRKPPREVLLRLRHPQAMPIKSVTVNGKKWHDFDPDKEIVRLHRARGAVRVVAKY